MLYYTAQSKVPFLNFHELSWTINVQTHSDEFIWTFIFIQVHSNSFINLQKHSETFKFLKVFLSAWMLIQIDSTWIKLNQFDSAWIAFSFKFLQVPSRSRKNPQNTTLTIKIVFSIKNYQFIFVLQRQLWLYHKTYRN